MCCQVRGACLHTLRANVNTKVREAGHDYATTAIELLTVRKLAIQCFVVSRCSKRKSVLNWNNALLHRYVVSFTVVVFDDVVIVRIRRPAGSGSEEYRRENSLHQPIDPS